MKSLANYQITSLGTAVSPFAGFSRTTVFTISTAGTGYVLGELISLALASGTVVITAKWRVTGISGGGVPTLLQLENAGWYSAKPTPVTGATYATTSNLSGTGLILTLTWLDNAVPDRCHAALIQAEGQDVRWRDDGVAPTATVGSSIADGDSLLYVFSSLAALQLIQTTASAKANVALYE